MDQEFRSEGQSQSGEPLLALTDTAVAMIKQTMVRQGVKDGGIRMTVAGGGCKGFQYSLTFATAARRGDEVVMQDEITAFLDPFSARHLRGTMLDYVTNREGTGFHFRRLDVARTIGCSSPILLRRCLSGNTRTEGCWNSAKRPLMELQFEVAKPSADDRASVAHPGLRPLSLCQKCRYVVCRCEAAA